VGFRGVTSTVLEQNLLNPKKPHLKALVKTWSYIHCKSPKQQIHGFFIKYAVKFKGNYKFSFDFSTWQTQFRTFDQAPNHAAKCHFVTQMWRNKVVVVPTSKRSLYHKGIMDAMQAWDVHVQSTAIEQACEAVTDLYMHVQANMSLVDGINTFKDFDCSPCVLVESASVEL
jgi:hypothetical protein